jgi:membrane protease YdiL (CAAX protease family)
LALITLGTAVLFLTMSAAASLAGSLRGEAGLAICALVIFTALIIERALFGIHPRQALGLLGLTRRPAGGLLPVLLISVPMVAYCPVLSVMTGTPVTMREGWILTAIGVFLQGGVAEEVIWRGFLFRHLRGGRGFWTASFLTMVLMVLAHVVLVWSLDPVSAAAAIIVSAVIVFPMCHVFELDHGAVWSVALMHAVVQGVPKLVDVPAEIASLAIVGWAVLSTLAPLLVFAFRRQVWAGVR